MYLRNSSQCQFAGSAVIMGIFYHLNPCVLPAEPEKKGRRGSAEDTRRKAKPRTVWDKPEILDLTDESFTLKWKASTIPP